MKTAYQKKTDKDIILRTQAVSHRFASEIGFIQTMNTKTMFLKDLQQ
jgi:hypothetical protein